MKKESPQEKGKYQHKLVYISPHIFTEELAIQRNLLQTSAKGGNKPLPNGGNVNNNTGSSGGDAGSAEDDGSPINNSKAGGFYEWD